MRIFQKIFFALLLAIAVNAGAQEFVSNQRPSKGTERTASLNRHKTMLQASPYKNLQWRNTGPDRISGRCTDVLGFQGNSNTIIAAFATGGIWKTDDAGNTWKSLFDKEGTLSIGSIAVAASDNQIIYAGTGESNIFRASLLGMGMYKSTDGGNTWKHIGLENTGTIARVVVHPANPDIVYVAAGGNEWSYNADRGVYQTTNGGKTWKKILGNDDKTGCIDLVMDPSEPNILYASMWNRIRKRWSDPVPEDGDYIYKTTDGGKTWKALTTGLPDTKFTGRVGLAIAKNNTDVLYAFVDNHEEKRKPKKGELDPYGRLRDVVVKGVEVYRTNNKGESWTKMTDNNDYMERFCGTYGWVFGQIRVDPNDENTVYIMGLGIGKSTDGGKTFKTMQADRKAGDNIHGDHHAMWIDPADSKRIINGNDGGVVITYDGGRRWQNFFSKIPTTQFYNVTYDTRVPYNIYGSVQDEGSFGGSIKNTYGVKDTTIQKWRPVPGGEGTIIALDPVDNTVMYASTYYGNLVKSKLTDADTFQARLVSLQSEEKDIHRGEWLAYTLISPHNHLTVYHGMQYLFKSADSGSTWKRISPDLSYNNAKRMGKTPYAINHQAITAIDESPSMQGLLYAGTDDGRVWVTRNDGGKWEEITKGLPSNAHVSRLVASRYNTSTVYVTLSDRREDNIAPYIFVSNNYGKTWKSLSGNLPPSPVNVIREDPKKKNILYCGTDMGVYVSKAAGAWVPLNNNLPLAVSVQDLFVHPAENNLVIATYGRGVWSLDDIRTLQK